MIRFEKKLKHLFQSQSASSGPVSRLNCPSPEELSFSFEPDCPPETKIRIIDHVFSCPACRREFELLRGARQLINRLEKKAPPQKAGLLNRKISIFGLVFPWWKMASALLAVFFVLSLVYLGLNYLSSMKEERQTESADQLVLREEVSWPRPAAVKLTWKPAGEGLFYRVEVYDQNLYLLWRSPRTHENSLELPEAVLDSLKDYQYFFWQLLIYSGENRLLESPVRKVRLGPQ